jgi:beta-glucanase (GH16 family)
MSIRLFSTALLAACLAKATAQTCPTLIWSDEFDGSNLNADNWTPQIGDGCDISVDLCGWGNNEAQFYRSQNIAVADGSLKINALRQTFGEKEFTSARIRSFEKFDIDLTQPYVRIEARIKVPLGQGLWGAFWMMPSPEVLWPKGGEIDVMEFIGREPNSAYGVIHYGNLFRDKSELGGPLKMPTSPSENFHIYTIEKTPNRIAWLVDGFEYQSYTNSDIQPKYSWPFEQTYHLILNLAVGGNWPGYPDRDQAVDVIMEVDYVRVYDMSGGSIGSITGESLVQINGADGLYCIDDSDVLFTDIAWTVPTGSSFTPSLDDGNCIIVAFGSVSGYIQAVGQTADCGPLSYSMPVEVQPLYQKEFAVVPIEEGSTTIGASTGSQSFLLIDGIPTLQYDRLASDLYDNIIIGTSDVSDASLYVSEQKKFYMDISSPTAATCTRVIIQFEDTTTALPDNYPIGRHSRYVGYLDDSESFQRVEFAYYDRPDTSVADNAVSQLAVLIDPFLFRGDRYLIRNFDSSSAGCSSNCEPLSTNACRTYAKSEQGMCTDGENNDREGYNGDDQIDCEDADCYGLDPACPLREGRATEVPTMLSPTLAPTVMPTGNASDPPSIVPSSETAFPTATGTVRVTSRSSDIPSSKPNIMPITSGPTSSAAPSYSNDEAECDAQPRCAALDLAGVCCPTIDAVYLDCCDNRPINPNSEAGFCNDGIDNDNDGLFDCEDPDCANDEMCRADCVAIGTCAGLSGQCCPTIDSIFLDCCDAAVLSAGYSVDFSLIDPATIEEQAAYWLSTSPYTVPGVAPDGSTPVVDYARDEATLYDMIYYQTGSIEKASEYVIGRRKIYMDVWTDAPECTQIILQFDSLPTAVADNYPTGRHSRYVAFTTRRNEWERIALDFWDRPDGDLDDTVINTIALFFDPGTLTSHQFYFRNMDSTLSGCRENCEVAAIDDYCLALSSGESGFCGDSLDQDGDGLIDCVDPDCTLDEACSAQLSISYSALQDNSFRTAASSSSAQVILNGGLIVSFLAILHTIA